MDERLKKKLELLGEPTLPDSLTAEELFRRIDCGELVLPEEPEVEAEAAPSDKVIPWMKVLRRGVPIAACLALVVFIAQGRIWRMGSSGGANFSEKAAAPQAAAATDQGALTNGSDGAPIESYSLDDEAATPEPFRSIAIEEDDQEAETTKGAAADDIAEEEVFDDVAEEDSADAVVSTKDEPLRPDTGGDDLRPDTGGDDLRPDTGGPATGGSDNENPDSGPVVNPDIGPADYDREQNNLASMREVALIEETFQQLHSQDPRLTGLTPILEKYGPVSALTPGETTTPLHVFYRYVNDAGDTVAFRVIKCYVNQRADGSHRLDFLSFEEWDGEADLF